MLRVVAVSIPETSSPKSFDRHIKRLVWCALMGSIALLVPVRWASSSIDSELTEALGATVVVVAALTVVRDVSRYVRYETARRREAARASLQAGACGAADAIQDRLTNLLSVTVGCVDLLAEGEQLPAEARQHAERALDSALAAARVVSAFRQSLGCESPSLSGSVQWRAPRAEAGRAGPPERAWHYDPDARTIIADDGALVARVSPLPDGSTEQRNGRLIADAPALWDVVGDAQQLAIALLADAASGHVEQARIREVLDRINAVTQRIEA
jgi:hypothetical protein